MMPDVNPGDRVLLMQLEDCPQEMGTVLTVDEFSWGTSLVVRVDFSFLEGPEDDGLRECTVDQVVEVIPCSLQ